MCQTGMIILLNGHPIHWKSRKQPLTSLSSACAEIYALSDTVKDAKLTMWRCAELGIHLPFPMQVKVDSTCAESFQRRTCLDSRLRGTFNLRDAWVRELQDAKLVATQHVASRDNLADLLTKPFSSSDFKRLVSAVLNSN